MWVLAVIKCNHIKQVCVLWSISPALNSALGSCARALMWQSHVKAAYLFPLFQTIEI